MTHPDFTATLKENGRLECAAVLLLPLLYPEQRPDDRLAQTYAALCGYLIRVWAQADDAWAQERQHIRPVHAVMPDKAIARIERDFQTRLPKALWTGFVILELLNAAEGEGRRSVETIAAELSAKLGMTDTNFKARVWREWAPSAHLCAAFAACHLARSTKDEVNFTLTHFLLSSDDAVVEFANFAELFEPSVLNDPRIPVDDGALRRSRVLRDWPDHKSHDF